MTRRLTYVEIDIDYCALSYGVAPCTAAIPTTGDIKCFNSIATCQDRVNFSNAPVTLRFAMDTAYLPRDVAAIPSLLDVSLTPQTLALGEGLGTRGSITVSFKDHRHPDTGDGFDKYVGERPYVPFEQGSFWGKFRARQPYLRGRPLRLIRGDLGQDLAEMEVRHFVIETFDGPRPNGTYSIIAKDILKLADDDRAQAPRASNGFILSAIDTNDASVTLGPTGIGDFEYPDEGYVCIGGNEVCQFTRSGDTLSLTRARLGSTASSHNAEERAQLVLRYSGEDPANIIADLLETYAGVSSDFIPLANWLNETDAFLKRVYTGTVVEPTGVNTLITEIVQQAGLGIWWDDVAQLIRLMVLRAVPPDAIELGPDVNMEETLATKEQPEKRVSQVWTFYAQRDPTKSLSDEDNYRSIAVTVDDDSETNYGAAAIKKIYARWIPEFGRSIATRANDLILGRYATPPRRFDLALLRGTVPNVALGRVFHVAGWPLQDVTGAAARAPAIITRFDPGDAMLKIEAEEAFFRTLDPLDLFDRVIVIDSNTQGFNLRTVHDQLYPEIEDPYGITLTCIIQAGVIVGSNSINTPAFRVGDWVPGLPITVRNLGRIQGKGGNGLRFNANGTTIYAPAQQGGTGLYTRYPIVLENNQIWGGGGGGGAWPRGSNYAAGGGGAGFPPGAAGTKIGTSTGEGNPGTITEGGDGQQGDGSGSHGQPAGRWAGGGDPGSPGFGAYDLDNIAGPAGFSIDGVSYVTNDGGQGNRRGPQVN